MKHKKTASKLFKSLLVFVLLLCLVMSSIPITFAASYKIKSLVVDDIEVIENTYGYYDSDWDDNNFYYYEYYYYINYTATLSDGTVIRDEGNWVEIGDDCYHIDIDDDQYENAWGIGTHTVTATLLGTKTTFNVNIVESPIESLEIRDVNIIEGEQTYEDWDYDYDNEEYLTYNVYNYTESIKYKVRLKNGEVIGDYGSWFEYNNRDYSIDFYDDQSYYNQWGRGHLRG